MQVRLAHFGIALGLLGAGCSLVQNATRVVTNRVSQALDDCAERKRNAQWAEEAWARIAGGDCPYSEEYGEGFKAGFADFLYQGGSGEPPPLPPNRYRTLHYQTPQGYRAVEDWFAGFRRGAEEARAGGYRQWVTGPSSLRAPMPVIPPPTVEAPSSPIPPTLPPPRLLQPDNGSENLPTPALNPVHWEEVDPPTATVWRIVYATPQEDAVATSMGDRSFQELMHTIMRKKQANRSVGGRHRLLVMRGTKSVAVEMDDATWSDVCAFLKWYYEAPGD